MRTPGFDPGMRESARTWVWCVLVVVAAAVLAITAVRWRGTARLREEVALRRSAQIHAADRVRANRPEETATVANEVEWARLRADREALPRLRAEVAALKQSVEETRLQVIKAPKADPAAPPDIAKEIVPAEAWRNAGYATPAAAVETALWAAAGGDTDVLMRSIVMDDGTRRKAAELLAGLPAETRARYSKPEELVALMAAKDVPLEGARIMIPAEATGEARKATVQLRNAAGSVRQVHIDLRETGAGWRLVVPEAAVDRYARSLKGVRMTTDR